MRMKARKIGSCEPIELPPSLHAFHRVSTSNQVNMVSHSSLLRMKSTSHYLFLLFLYNQQYFFIIPGRLPNISWRVLELL